MRHLLSCFITLLTLSFVVGCSTCNQCSHHEHQAWHEGRDQGCSGCGEPISSWPKLNFKKSKCKHQKDDCPLCAGPSGHQNCSGCSAPTNYGYVGGSPSCASCGGGQTYTNFAPPSGCSSCSAPPQMASFGCSSCGGAQPTPSCSSCGGTVPYSTAPGALYEGEVIPGQSPSPMPTPAPAPPAEEKKLEPGPLQNSTTLIPILPPTSGPRHVNWVPTPVK